VVFVLSGGGNLGAVQVGQLQALADRNIRADAVVGCSVGALNGAAFAADPTHEGVARLEDVWLGLGLDQEQLMPKRRLPPAVRMARKGKSLFDNDGLRALIAAILPCETFEELQVPFHCIATAIEPPAEKWFSTGPLVDPLLASAALPGVFPIVPIDGEPHFDGAVLNEIPISRALELGARTIYVLHVGNLDRPWIEPRRPMDAAIQAYWIARRQRLQRDLAAVPPEVDVIVLPRGDPPEPRFDDFSHTPELITQAYGATTAHLDALAGHEGEADQPMPPSHPTAGYEPPEVARPDDVDPEADPPAADEERVSGDADGAIGA
jgi:NTE family protein